MVQQINEQETEACFERLDPLVAIKTSTPADLKDAVSRLPPRFRDVVLTRYAMPRI